MLAFLIRQKLALRYEFSAARKFERLLIHLDVDVLDFADMPLAEVSAKPEPAQAVPFFLSPLSISCGVLRLL